MSKNELKMEDYPAHWKATLMGEAFWKDAEEFNQPISDSIDAHSHPPLLSRFPFNLAFEQSNPPHQEDQPSDQEEKRHRRFSTSDALRSFARASSPFPPPSRAFDLRRGRSQSRSISPSARRSSSLLRSTINMLSNKTAEPADEDPKRARIPANQATPTHPLLSFRGGETWASLDKGRRSLGLDVFLPIDIAKEPAPAVTTDDETSSEIIYYSEFSILPAKELEPLGQFRKLRVLKITGMMQSYQKQIWEAAWLNVELEELEMGMVLKPRIRRPYVEQWPYIKGGWTLNKATYGEPVYYGTAMSTGTLSPKIGRGEYLDKILMEKAKIRALALGRSRSRLSLKILKLTGFVVDADPFLHWFDPKRLRAIHFVDYCVDAGFYLSLPMSKVAVVFPREVSEKVEVGRRVDVKGEVKVVRLEGGRKVGEVPYKGRESLEGEISRNLARSEVDRGEAEGDAQSEPKAEAKNEPVVEAKDNNDPDAKIRRNSM